MPGQIRPVRFLVRHRELFLTVAALLLILCAEHLFGPRMPRLTADIVTAVIVTALGLSTWSARRHRARIVREAICRVRAMLTDRINNQLQIVMTHLDPGPGNYAADRERLREVTAAIRAVAGILNDLSPDTLDDWMAQIPRP